MFGFNNPKKKFVCKYRIGQIVQDREEGIMSVVYSVLNCYRGNIKSKDCIIYGISFSGGLWQGKNPHILAKNLDEYIEIS